MFASSWCVCPFVLAALPKLNSLYLSHNRLEHVEDIEHLKECRTLSVVDLSHNCIEDADATEVFSQMPSVVSRDEGEESTFTISIV